MFTITEFLKGVKEYRKKIQNEGKEGYNALKEYEKERYIVEKSIIEASKCKDRDVLFEIIKKQKYLLELIDGRKQIISRKECEIISVVLTYMSIVHKECGLTCSEFDDRFMQADLVSRGTAGGITIRLQKFENVPLTIICKTTNTFDIIEDKSLIHEWFVGYTCLNSLRRYIPSFAYVYSIVDCSGVLMNTELTEVASICGFFFGGGHVMLMQEDISDSVSLFRYLTDNRDRITLETFLDILLQVLMALDMAYKKFGFTHYDLHTANILIQETGVIFDVGYFMGRITTSLRVVIIDQAFSHVKYDIGKSSSANKGGELFSIPQKAKFFTEYGTINDVGGGVLHDRPYPLFDIFRVFFDMYDLAPLHLKKNLLPLVRVFFKDMTLTRAISKSFTSSTLNHFSLPSFSPDFLSYTYEDFINEIWRNYEETLQKFIIYTKGTYPIMSSSKLETVLNYISRKISVTEPNSLLIIHDLGIIDKVTEKEIINLRKRWLEGKNQIIPYLNIRYKEIIERIDHLVKFRSRSSKMQYKDIINPTFFKNFAKNAILLSEITRRANIIERTISIVRICEDFLYVEEEDLLHLPNDRYVSFPEQLSIISDNMLNVGKEVISIMKFMFKHKLTKRSQTSVEYFWYSVCSLLALQYAEYCSKL